MILPAAAGGLRPARRAQDIYDSLRGFPIHARP